MDIKILDYMTLIRLDVSIWAGRAKLRAEDLPLSVQTELPPDTLTSLGSKKLFDPTQLKVFNTLKARAHGALQKKCVSLMGGYATHNDRLPDLAEQLSVVASDFEYEKQRFLDDYVQSSAEWVANFPAWSHILLNALPKQWEIATKFNFSWQAYQIQPVENMDGFIGNNLNSTLTNLERDVIEEIARDIKVIYRECFDNKEKVTKKAFRPMQTLIDKVRSLGFIHHHLVGLEGVLVEVKAIGEQAPEDEKTIHMVKAFLTTLTTPQGVQAICDEYCEQNKSLGQVLDPFWLANQPGMTVQTIPIAPGICIEPHGTAVPVQPVSLPKLPPGWVPQTLQPLTQPKITPDFIAQAKAAVELYEDRQMGIEPIDLTTPVGSQGVIEDDNGLW